MDGSRLPFPWPDGQPMTLRAALHRRPCSAGQKKALARGEDVRFYAAWLLSHFPRGREQHPSLPTTEGSGAHPVWVLTGDDRLEPVT